MRMQKTLDELVPVFAAAAPPPQCNPTSAVDLSNAQNEVLRSELLEFFKSTIEDQLTSKVCMRQVAPLSSVAHTKTGLRLARPQSAWRGRPAS